MDLYVYSRGKETKHFLYLHTLVKLDTHSTRNTVIAISLKNIIFY